MRLMMTLIADTAQNVDAISAYLANESVNLLGSEQLLDEGATITEHGDAPAVVERDLSAASAVDRRRAVACGGRSRHAQELRAERAHVLQRGPPLFPAGCPPAV